MVYTPNKPKTIELASSEDGYWLRLTLTWPSGKTTSSWHAPWERETLYDAFSRFGDADVRKD